jgi:hypothetical protein
MHLGQVRRPGRQLDAPRHGDQRRQKLHAVGDVLRLVGQVLADERVMKAELVGEDHGLAILLEGLPPVARDGMNGHGEVAQSHQSRLHRPAAATERRTAVLERRHAGQAPRIASIASNSHAADQIVEQ